MASRVRANPLALAVLCCLYERPMHPYEISQTLRIRAKQESIRLNYGSLYGVVASLEKRQLIRAVETVREGRRPERTIYAITDAGATEMTEWLSELVAVPVKEYLQFEAGLSLIGTLPPDDAVELLRQRRQTLEYALVQSEAVHDRFAKEGFPRLYLIEDEYKVALLRAELDFVQRLIDDIDAGDLGGLDEWRALHDEARGDDRPRHSDRTQPTDGEGDQTP